MLYEKFTSLKNSPQKNCQNHHHRRVFICNLEFGPSNARNGYETAAQAHSVEGVAGNGYDGGGTGGGGDIICGLITTLCGAFCKDNPLGESLGMNQTNGGANANTQPMQATPISNQSKHCVKYMFGGGCSLCFGIFERHYRIYRADTIVVLAAMRFRYLYV